MTKRKSSSSRSRSSKSKPKSTRGGTSSRRSTSSRKKTSSRKTSSRKRASSKRKFALPKLPKPNINLDLPQKAILIGMALMGFSFILVLSLASPQQGELTRDLSEVMRVAFGWGGLLIPLVTIGIGFYLVLWGMDQAPKVPRTRMLGLGVLVATFEAFASLVVVAINNGLSDVWTVAQAQTGGGYFGSFIAWVLMSLIGQVGAVFVLAIVGLVGSALVFGVTRTELLELWQFVINQFTRPEPIPENAATADIPINPGRSNRTLRRRNQPEGEPTPQPVIRTLPIANKKAEKPEDEKPRRGRRQKKEEDTTPTIAPVPLVLNNEPAGQTWTLPTFSDVLERGRDQEIGSDTIREQVEVIEHTLESFGAPGIVVEINQGPTVTQYGIEPQYIVQRSGKRTKVKVSKIAGLADDLALALAAHAVRVQAPVPGKGYIGIEVPNSQKALVSLRDVMESSAFKKLKTNLRMGLGQNVAGQAIAADLTKMPHMLVAGATGAGKSVCVNGIIAAFLLQNTPDDLRLVMIDPKRVELTSYNGIPHLIAPVVVDMERVIGTLQWALREMDRRYKKLAEFGARNITDFNKKMKRLGETKLPYIVIIIDELADLMMTAPEDTERAITRLAQMARATGIHMIIATQRPSVDVVTGLIKANFPARIAFAVASSTDSRVILDTVGAERLLGQGDMLFQSPDAGTPVRLQGSYVSDEELRRIIRYWQGARRANFITAQDAEKRDQGSGNGDRQTVVSEQSSVNSGQSATNSQQSTANGQPPAANSQPPAANRQPPTANRQPPATSVQQPLWDDLIEEAKSGEKVYDDELTLEAIALVRKLNKASTSLLQRRFRIGYTRAARLMDVLEEEGIIGPPTGTSKPREVLSETPAGEPESEPKATTRN